MRYPKITSEKQYREYCERRLRLADMGSVYPRLYNKEINELNLRIIEWNCRHDDHRYVYIPDASEQDKNSDLKIALKLHLLKSKLET